MTRIRAGNQIISHIGPFGTRSLDGTTRGYGWTDEGVQMELIWQEMWDEPFTMEEWKIYNRILDELNQNKPYSPQMMRSLNDPRLRQLILEEVCKRSIK
jgi:hypothetical protein